MFLTWVYTDKLTVVRGGQNVFGSMVFVWSFFDCWLSVFTLCSLPAVCLKLCVFGVIFSKLFSLVWLWQVLEAQRRHQKEKSGIIPTSPTPYTYNKVGDEIFILTPQGSLSSVRCLWPSGNVANSIFIPYYPSAKGWKQPHMYLEFKFLSDEIWNKILINWAFAAGTKGYVVTIGYLFG